MSNYGISEIKVRMGAQLDGEGNASLGSRNHLKPTSLARQQATTQLTGFHGNKP